MRVSRFSLFAAVLAVGLLSGCGPTWKVVMASDPTQLGNANSVAVQFDYSQLYVGKYTAEQWKAEQLAKDPAYQTTWDDLITKYESYFLQGLKRAVPGAHPAAEGPGDVTLTVKPQSLTMGKYVVVARTATSVTTLVSAHAGEGEDTDIISMTASYPASVTQPSVFQHIGHVGENLGAQTGRFLESKKAK